MTANDNILFICASRMAEIHLLVQKTFRRTKFMYLHTVFVHTCQHKDYAIGYLRNSLSQFPLNFRCYRAYIHNRLCVYMTILRTDNGQFHTFAQSILQNSLLPHISLIPLSRPG